MVIKDTVCYAEIYLIQNGILFHSEASFDKWTYFIDFTKHLLAFPESSKQAVGNTYKVSAVFPAALKGAHS